LFRGQQCRFKRHSKDIITACSIAAAGASDKGVQSVIFGTLKAIAEEMDIKISAKQLSKGTPARNSLRNWEVNLAAGCLKEVVHQIHLDAERLRRKYGNRVKLQITLITDHGNCDGIDHFVKMICWASEDEKGNKLLRHFNLDIDRGGHSAVAACNAIIKSLEPLNLAERNVEIYFIVGDNGGGAAVHQLYPKLKESGTLAETSDFVNCIFHAMNLAYKIASKDSLGDTGMNALTVFQMCYLAILMLMTIKKQTSLDHLTKIYENTMSQLLKSEEYVDSAGESFIQALEEMVDFVVGDSDTSTFDAQRDLRIDELLGGCPKDVKEPNFGRWGTVSAVANVVLKHWLPIFYIAQNVQIDEKNGSYLHIIATKLMELMSSKADPEQESPTHYTSLQWIVGFGDAMYDANLDWVKKNYPDFGAGSYGHITRLVPEHLYVMQKQIDSLKDDGWKSNPLFSGFIKAVEGVSEMGGVEKSGREFFNRLPGLYIERFEQTLHEHTMKWRTNETLPVVIAGHPTIAKWFLKWVFDDATIPTDLNVELYNHQLKDKTPSVNVYDCLNWLTHGFTLDREKMQCDSLIQLLMEEITIICDSDEPIDIIDELCWASGGASAKSRELGADGWVSWSNARRGGQALRSRKDSLPFPSRLQLLGFGDCTPTNNREATENHRAPFATTPTSATANTTKASEACQTSRRQTKSGVVGRVDRQQT
jgi:hypothetical protein